MEEGSKLCGNCGSYVEYGEEATQLPKSEITKTNPVRTIVVAALVLVIVVSGFFTWRAINPIAPGVEQTFNAEEAQAAAEQTGAETAANTKAETAQALAAAEKARAEAERLLAETQRLKAEEQARIAAEAKAREQAEQERIAQEQARAAEAERIAQEQARAAEVERIAQEQARAAEQARIAAEQARAAEEARIAQERARVVAEQARAAEQERIAQEQARIAAEKSKPQTITLSTRTPIKIITSSIITAETARTREEFTAKLNGDIVSGDRVIAQKGSNVKGRVSKSDANSRTETTNISLILTKLTLADGREVSINTTEQNYLASSATRTIMGDPSIMGNTSNRAKVPSGITFTFYLTSSLDVVLK